MVAARSEPDQTRILNQDPQRIRRRRVAAGLDQQSLARLAGISKTHMWQIEHGKCSASPEKLRQLATALECQITDLMPPDDSAVVTHLLSSGGPSEVGTEPEQGAA